jgi:hypothetical protein
VVAEQVPVDGKLAGVVGAAQVENLLLDVGRGTTLRVLRAGLGVDERRLAVPLIRALPALEDLTRDAEVATSL